MKRNDASHIFPARDFEQRSESFSRAQLDIDIAGVGQKSRKQFAALFDRQVIRTAFARMSRGDDERRW